VARKIWAIASDKAREKQTISISSCFYSIYFSAMRFKERFSARLTSGFAEVRRFCDELAFAGLHGRNHRAGDLIGFAQLGKGR
jgi:hypothetical protein